jgi:hypothetical protein
VRLFFAEFAGNAKSDIALALAKDLGLHFVSLARTIYLVVEVDFCGDDIGHCLVRQSA